jgi:phosphoglucosamine mutase
MRLFGSSGIRGLANTEITVELVSKIGMVVGSLHKNVILGHDPRTSSPLMLHALTSGLLSTGCEVHVAGLVTTPTLAHAARNFSCGIMITASHNPPEYNGIKFFNPDGSGFNTQQMEEIESMMTENNIKPAAWGSIKNTTVYQNAVEDHIQSILKHIPKLNLKIVVDCGCGAASTITPFLFRRLGCQVTTLNCQPDGFFPGRKSEPSFENLSSLISAVSSLGADLGIAHDGDADRMVAVDEKGNYVGGDSLLTLFAKHEAKSSIVVPVNASMAVSEVVGDAEIHYSKVGDVFVSEMIKKHNSDFGGEPSGTWIFPAHNFCPDGIFAAARLAELVQNEHLSVQIAKLPKYPREKGTLGCPNTKKSHAMRMLLSQFSDMNPKALATDDGIRAEFEHSWVLVRPSGTEPKIRITTEAENKEEAKRMYAKIVEEVKGCVTK